jgi:glycosyltransferase involved in cell wall biosynthesis
MRVHIPGLVHRDANSDWAPDAYVGKLWRLARMLVGLGHEVFVYGGPHTDTPATSVTVLTEEDRRRWFGDETWETIVYNQFDPMSAPWMTMNSRVIQAIAERLEPHDIIGLTMGQSQAAIQQAFPSHVVCEVGCGYEGVLGNTQRCFESYAWMHYIWGRTGVTDGRYYDTVIPNAFNPTDYEYGLAKDDYLLFMGRLTPRKGLEVVAELAKRHRVVTAGQGEPIPGIEHLGVVRGKEKAVLLAEARAVLVPTVYVPPFEGVNVEAQLSGTPVICSPFGAFAETVRHGETGFLCHTMGEFAKAAETVDDLDPKTCRDWALDQFTLDVCAPQYDRWLNQLAGLYGSGWYA